MKTFTTPRTLGVLATFLVLTASIQAQVPAPVPAPPTPAVPTPKSDTPIEPAKLSEAIENSVKWYDILPEGGAKALTPIPVLRWRNVVRGQEGEAMMLIWAHQGRPIAMASIYPWEGDMVHEFDSLSRDSKLKALDKDRIIWAPNAAGVEFQEVPNAPKPGKSAAERLLQMKGIAAKFHAKMTGWQADNSDQENLRLLTRPLHRYDLKNGNDTEPKLLDGCLFAYVQGTDPEVVLMLEVVGNEQKATWQFAFVRATSGGLEVKLGDNVVWTAAKHPANRVPTSPHYSMHRRMEK